MTPEPTPEYQLIQQRIDHERELREATATQLKIALDLQAKEYERRLEDLNGAHKRAAEERAMFVKQDMYDARSRTIDEWKETHTKEQELWRAEHIKENDEWKLSISTEMAVRRGEEAQTRRSWTIAVVSASLAINGIALILAFMIHNARAVVP